MQPFLRSLLSGILTATAVGLGLLLTLALLGAVADGVFDVLLYLGGFLLAIFGAGLTAAAVGLTVARHADGRGQALLSGLLAGVVGQFIVLVLLVLGLALAVAGEPTDPDDPLAEDADDGVVSAGTFSRALLALVPAGITAGLVGLAAGKRQPDPYGAPDASYASYADAPDDVDDRDEPDDAPAAPRTLTCPRCHTSNPVPEGGGRIVCRECGLPGRVPAS